MQSGERFNRLTAIAYVRTDKNRQRVWLFKCDCGNEKEIVASNVKRGHTRSCGCLNREVNLLHPNAKVHGMGKTEIYSRWQAMKRRCNARPNSRTFKWYGAKGITVCNEWKEFQPFYDWAISNGYKKGLSLDRIDNSKGYCPENCRWVTMKEQQFNKSTNRYISIGDEIHTITQWAEIKGISISTIYQRINKGWNVEDAITIKKRGYIK